MPVCSKVLTRTSAHIETTAVKSSQAQLSKENNWIRVSLQFLNNL